MTKDEKILELNNEITTLLFNLYQYNQDMMPDLRDYEDADVNDLEELRDQLIEVYDMMSNIYYKYSEEEQ